MSNQRSGSSTRATGSILTASQVDPLEDVRVVRAVSTHCGGDPVSPIHKNTHTEAIKKSSLAIYAI